MPHKDHNSQHGDGSSRGSRPGSNPKPELVRESASSAPVKPKGVGTRPRPGPDPGRPRSPAPGTSFFSFPTRTSRTSVRLAALLRAGGGRVLAAATGEAGRRVARAVALTVALGVLVAALYDRGEVPVAAAQPAVADPAGATNGPAGRTRGGAARRADPGSLGGLRGRERPAPVGERPAAVAAAWYAARQGVPRAKVKPLQQDRLSAREVRVLVLADHGRGRLRTALVRVRLGRDGWRVR